MIGSMIVSLEFDDDMSELIMMTEIHSEEVREMIGEGVRENERG